MSKKGSLDQIIGSDQAVLVDFFATWCGPCQAMQPVLEETARLVGDKVKVIKIDVDKNPSAASKYQVRGVPTLMLFQNGKTLWRQSGVVPAHQLVQVIREHVKYT